MADVRQRTLVSVRATCNNASSTKVFARSSSTEFGVPFSFDRTKPNLTGAENLLGLLAADIAGLFSESAKRKRLDIDRIEVTAKAALDASLAYLGVIGTEGTPSYKEFELKMFVDSPASRSELDQVWLEATQRAPLLNTLRQATEVKTELVIVD